MRAVADELIDRFAATGECEFMADFAGHYPARMICELLGVPARQQAAFEGWADDIGLMISPNLVEHLDRVEAALAGLYQAVDQLIERCRTQPLPGLLSDLVAVEESGDRLSTQELRLMVSALLFGGQDTTRHQLGLGMATFIAHPDQWRLLADRPELGVQAAEEILRTTPAVPLTARLATEDCTFHGLEVPAGTLLFMLVTAANTDPAVFGDTSFDITATGPRSSPSAAASTTASAPSWPAPKSPKPCPSWPADSAIPSCPAGRSGVRPSASPDRSLCGCASPRRRRVSWGRAEGCPGGAGGCGTFRRRGGPVPRRWPGRECWAWSRGSWFHSVDERAAELLRRGMGRQSASHGPC